MAQLDTKNLYLTLLRECLLDNLYGPPERLNNSEGTNRYASFKDVEVGTYWPKRAHTMIGRKRLENIRLCLERCLQEKIEGDVIETGVWRGGATIFMKGILKVNDVGDRKVFVADSFEGLPRPDPEKYPVDKEDTHYQHSFLSVSEESVRDNFKAYDLLDENVVFIKGFFETSLKNVPIKKLALLRLDGDMYSSTIQVLEELYDKVSIGGFIIIDDYAFRGVVQPGAKQAVTDFRRRKNITDEIHPIDDFSVYWRKTK